MDQRIRDPDQKSGKFSEIHDWLSRNYLRKRRIYEVLDKDDQYWFSKLNILGRDEKG